MMQNTVTDLRKINRNVVKTLRSALLCAMAIAVVIFTGRFLADHARAYLSQEQVELPVLGTVDQQISEQTALGPRAALEILVDYASAYLDAAIEFDFVPITDYRAFLNIVGSVPTHLKIDHFLFGEGQIRIFCQSDSNTVNLFVYHLVQKDYFSAVYTEEVKGQVTVVCLR